MQSSDVYRCAWCYCFSPGRGQMQTFFLFVHMPPVSIVLHVQGFAVINWKELCPLDRQESSVLPVKKKAYIFFTNIR